MLIYGEMASLDENQVIQVLRTQAFRIMSPGSLNSGSNKELTDNSCRIREFRLIDRLRTQDPMSLVL